MTIDSTPNLEIDLGAVFVMRGEHSGRIGFYCLQNEQTYDANNIAICPNCKLTKGELKSTSTNLSGGATSFADPIEIETGTYCDTHRRALMENDMAVVYWDRPYGDDYALIHPSDLKPILSTEYARYEKESEGELKETLLQFIKMFNHESQF